MFYCHDDAVSAGAVRLKAAALATIFLTALIWVLAAAGAAASESRVALVIANAAYQHGGRLRNPPNDAAAVAQALRRVGFTVVSKNDLDRDQLEAALKTFSRDAAAADIALVYYAGHGMEKAGANYLIPTDAVLAADSDVDFETVPLDLVMRSVEGARRLKVVILDACRNNPFRDTMRRSDGTRSIGRGLAPPPDPEEGDMLVAFAAEAGATAEDGKSANSPFALALSHHLLDAGVDIRIMFGKVRDDVRAATNRQQDPAIYESLSGDEFDLAPLAARVSETPGAAAPNLEADLWRNALSDNAAGAYQGYLSTFPNGPHADEARTRLSALGAVPAGKPAPAQLAVANASRPVGGPALSARSARVVAALRPYNRSRIHVYPDIPAPILETAQAWVGKRCGAQILAVFDQSILGNGAGDETVFCENEIFARKKGLVELQFRYGYAELAKFRPVLQGQFAVRYGQMVLNANFFPSLGNDSALFALLVNGVVAAAMANGGH